MTWQQIEEEGDLQKKIEEEEEVQLDQIVREQESCRSAGGTRSSTVETEDFQ